MLPLDIVGVLHQELRNKRRPPDGLLHASGDLIGSLRHAQLTAAGAPRIESELVSDIRLMTGTLWHLFVADALSSKGIAFQHEVKVIEGLPEGWSGTADWLFWDSHKRGWVLGDLKTTKGEAIRWIKRDGAKQEHLWQCSAYWHGLVEMGFPMVEGFAVLYWPMNDVASRDLEVEPSLEECTPLPRDLVWGVMEERWVLTKQYLDSLPRNAGGLILANADGTSYVTDELAPEQEREQKLVWNSKQGVIDLKLVPHWSAQYCPYPNELCACSEQGVTKVGHYTLEGEYEVRKGYEDINPQLIPSERELAARREEKV